MKGTLVCVVFMFVLMIGLGSAIEICQTYDDFSSGSLDSSKLEIRQDVEGQPFMDNYGVVFENGSYVFHMQQNNIGDRRVYLVPKHNFTTGDVLEYDYNFVSGEGNHMSMALLTGDQYIRMGISGYNNGVQGYDEFGISHIKVEFQENNLHLERTSPSNVTLIDNLALTNSNGNYVLYIGGVSGHNGIIHIDFDNFKVCSDEETPVVPEFNTIILTLTILGALSTFFLIRKS